MSAAPKNDNVSYLNSDTVSEIRNPFGFRNRFPIWFAADPAAARGDPRRATTREGSP